MGEPLIHVEPAAAARRPALGYAMVWTAAVLFALNGNVSKVLLASPISELELTQVRSAGACVGFVLALAVVRPRSLRVRARELPFLVAFGIAGVAFVQWLYFIAIHLLPVGIALIIQYLGPLFVALFARTVLHEPVRRRVWLALALALAGLTLIVELWSAGGVRGAGVAAALAAAVAYAVYLLMADRGVEDRDPLSLSAYGFLFASAFLLALHPPWRFPAGEIDESVSLLGSLAGVHAPVWTLLLFVVVVGTMVTFALVVGALRHIPATRVGIVAMLEPVVATVVAWAWLGEELGAVQLTGGAIVLAGIVVAQTAR